MQRDKRNLVSCKFVSVPCHLFLRYLYIFTFYDGIDIRKWLFASYKYWKGSSNGTLLE